MKKLIVSILFLSLVTFCPSCKKDSDEFIVTGTTTLILKDTIKDTVWEDESKLVTLPTTFNIEKLANELSKTSDKNVFDAELGGKITTPEDVTVNIPANACVTKTNQPCTGKIDIEILFLKTKGELIANDKPTTSGGKLLISGGVVKIMASQSGQEVKIASGKSLKIRFKNASPDPNMRFFEGKTDGRFKFDWVQIIGTGSQNIANVTTWADSTLNRENRGYEIVTDRFGWINCDKFSDDQNLTNKFSVALPDTFTNRNTSVYIVFKDINSVVKLEGNPSTKQFSIPNGYKGIPIGRNVIVVSTSKFDTQSMLDVQETTVTATTTVKMKPQRSTPEEMKKKIHNL